MYTRQLRIIKCRESLWTFCKTLAPDFYKDSRPHLKKLCDTLQGIYDGTLLKPDGTPYIRLIINEPPQTGKSRTLIMFCKWCLGKSTKNRIMTTSFNDMAATTFSKYTRNDIMTEKNNPEEIIYHDIFPIKVKHGDASYKRWALEGEHFNYLGSGIRSTQTSVGCNIAIVDDPVKSAEDALNEEHLEKLWTWYADTFQSRIHKGAIRIVNHTRWAKGDICGRILAGKYAHEWYILRMPVESNGKLLCEELIDWDMLAELKDTLSDFIFQANYYQEPIDLKGLLYTSGFKTYTELPKDSSGQSATTKHISYIDTADEGNDYLCCICAEWYMRKIYVTDVYYTKEPQEITEPATANMLIKNNIKESVVESNNGGRAFSRNIDRILREQNYRCYIKWFHQSQNKKARIMSNSANVQNDVLFPVDWRSRWPEFYKSLTTYSKEGKNKHDDSCFVKGTMVNTIMGDKPIEKIKKGDYVLTPFGFRKVLDSKETGYKEVVSNIGLTGTPDHKIYTDGNFSELNKIKKVSSDAKLIYRELLKWRYLKLLFLMESHIREWEGKETIILAKQKTIKEESMLKDFMSQFGNSIIKGQFLKAIVFIIKMGIILITTSITLSWLRLLSIFPSILKKTGKTPNTEKEDLRYLRKIETKRRLGIGVKKVDYGTRNMVKRLCVIVKKSIFSVFSVEKFLRLFKRGPNIAQKAVEANIEHDTIKGLYMKKNVLCLEKNIPYLTTKSRQKLEVYAQPHAEMSKHIKIEKVYNLTVEIDGVYYANNILVSNCDSLTGLFEILNGKRRVVTTGVNAGAFGF